MRTHRALEITRCIPQIALDEPWCGNLFRAQLAKPVPHAEHDDMNALFVRQARSRIEQPLQELSIRSDVDGAVHAEFPEPEPRSFDHWLRCEAGRQSNRELRRSQALR